MTIDSYIQQLTLEEKAALLQGRTSWTTHAIDRLGIPSIFLADGPHGLRKQSTKTDNMGIHDSYPATCFPTAATMANSWDPELGEQLGAALGQEAAANDVHIVLGPGLNMKRSPLCGRNFEYFSEDPYLAGKLAAAYIRGIQSTGVGACPKHFAVNSQELRRMSNNSVVDERTMQEIYLTAFEIAIQEGDPKSIMSSYNLVNGTYANENAHLLQDILRKQLGFRGFVMSDWGASHDHVEGVRNGSALEMPGAGAHSALYLIDAVRNGTLPERALDDRLRELLPVVFEVSAAVEEAAKVVDRRAHHALAEKCAAASIVLLENDGVLPLESRTKVALIGQFAAHPRYQGAGSSRVNPTALVDLKDALEDSTLELTGYYRGYSLQSAQPDAALIEQAVEGAKRAQVVLMCIGLDDASESEGMDRAHMKLPPCQTALLEAVSKVNPNVVLVLAGGSPFVMPPAEQYRAAIHGYLGGQAGAGAMAKAIMGEVNPCGKLSETWPLSLEDTPTGLDYPGTGKHTLYKEGMFIGYRYYDTAGVPVRYPFGYGLSYTTFAYSDLSVDSRSVSFTLTNTGSRDGAEIAQVYIACRGGQVIRPKKELKGFQKVHLKAGESRRVTVPLDDKAFRYFNTDTHSYERETANYDVMVAASAADIRLSTTIRIFGTDAPVPEKESKLPNYRAGNIRAVTEEEFELLLGGPAPKEPEVSVITLEHTIGQFDRAKNPVARAISRAMARKLEKAAASGECAPTELFVYNLPIHAICKLTSGKVTAKMGRDVALMANGHFFRGAGRLIRDYIRGRREEKEFYAMLEQE